MQRLGPAIDAAFGRPHAIVSVSAHTAARVPVLLARAAPRGDLRLRRLRPDALNELRYDAPGDPALAARVTGAAAGGRHRRAAASTKAASTTASGPRCATSTRTPTSRCCRWPSCRAMRRRSSSRSAPRSRRWPTKACSCSAAAASRTTCGACSRRRPASATRRSRRSPESAAFRHWIAERSARRATGTRCSTTARQAPHAVDDAPDRRAPAAVVRGRRRRRPRRAAAAHPRQRDHRQPRHGRLCVRPDAPRLAEALAPAEAT